MEKQKEQLINDNKVINARIKTLESPQRIIKIAENKLGMKIAENAPINIKEQDED